jgi:hypothetical protein
VGEVAQEAIHLGRQAILDRDQSVFAYVPLSG